MRIAVVVLVLFALGWATWALLELRRRRARDRRLMANIERHQKLLEHPPKLLVVDQPLTNEEVASIKERYLAGAPVPHFTILPEGRVVQHVRATAGPSGSSHDWTKGVRATTGPLPEFQVAFVDEQPRRGEEGFDWSAMSWLDSP